MLFVPHEFHIGGVYFSPLLISAILGMLAAGLTARVLNRRRLSRCLAYPPVVFLAMAVLYTAFAATFLVPSRSHEAMKP